VQHLAHIVSAAAHNFKPLLRDGAQLTGMRVEPGFDCWIALESVCESKKLAHD
jgi:hypothetical protein